MGLDEVAADLYGGDPDRFVENRKAAAVAARASGDAALAKAVLALKRPTRSAWLVNLVVHGDDTAAPRLGRLAAQLAQVHQQGDLAGVRAASAERSRLVSELTRRAVTLGEAAGYSAGEPVRAEVAATLEAAVADPEALALVRSGRVVKSLNYAGFGPGLVLGAGPVREAAETTVGESELVTEPQDATRNDQALTAARASFTQATARAGLASARHASARERAELAADASSRAAARVDELRSELDRAEVEQSRAEAAAQAATAAVQEAATAEEQARAELAAAALELAQLASG